jgi:hypothetical protein
MMMREKNKSVNLKESMNLDESVNFKKMWI